MLTAISHVPHSLAPDSSMPEPDGRHDEERGSQRAPTQNVVDGVVAVTREAWLAAPDAKDDDEWNGIACGDIEYAPASVRDRFLDALDQGDPALCSELAANLIACKNPLPGMTCDLLQLPAGSTYGRAARHVLVRSRTTALKASV